MNLYIINFRNNIHNMYFRTSTNKDLFSIDINGKIYYSTFQFGTNFLERVNIL